MGFDYDTIRLKRAIYTVLADLIVAARAGGTPTPEAFERLNDDARAPSRSK